MCFIPVPQFPMGFSVAASVQVGNALGAGNTEQAKLSSKVSLICACMSQICSLVILHHSRGNGCCVKLCYGGRAPWICSSDLQTKSFSKPCAIFVNLNVLVSVSLCLTVHIMIVYILPLLCTNMLCFLCPIQVLSHVSLGLVLLSQRM